MLFGGSPTPCILVTAFLPRQTTGSQLLSTLGLGQSHSLTDPVLGASGPTFHAHTDPAFPVLSRLPCVCAQGAAPSLHQHRARHSLGCSAGANHAKKIHQVCRSLSWCHEERGGRGRCGQPGTLYTHADRYRYTYVYIYIGTYIHAHTYICTYTRICANADTGIRGVPNTALNFCQLCGPKAMLCHV